jgi:anti-sigma B factor antagonist
MKLNKRLIDDVAVVALTGALDAESAADVQDRISRVLPLHEHVVLDFSKVSCVSSASLRTLVLVYRQAQSLGHSVAVVGLSPEVHNVLDATGFLDFFVLADTVTGGVAGVLDKQEGRRERDHAIARA